MDKSFSSSFSTSSIVEDVSDAKDAAVRGALLNVKINLSSIKDEAYVADLKQKCFELEESAIKAEAHILSLVPELA